jgi:hypothetical protein
LFNKQQTQADQVENKNNVEQEDPEKERRDAIAQMEEEDRKLGLFKRFKKMAKEYWYDIDLFIHDFRALHHCFCLHSFRYVLIPVHLATSACWLGGFFYMSKSGVDIVGMLEAYNFSEVLVKPFRDSHLGHIAVAYLLYKIATPARYTVTLGGTTFAIKYLVRGGYIKPMPTRKELVQIYKDKRDDIKEKISDKKDELIEKVADKKQEIKDKAEELKSKMSKF